MPESLSSRGEPRADAKVSHYVRQFQERLPGFLQEHRAELRQVGTDALGRLFHEHVLFGDRNSYDALLQGMLTAEERDRLQTDLEFTRAWQIFSDLCWLKKTLRRAGLMLVVILLGLLLIAFTFLALHHTSGPQNR